MPDETIAVNRRARHDYAIEDTLEAAVKLIIATQNEDGGWRYKPEPVEADISVTICQIMALRAARNAGIVVPNETVDRCIDYVKRSQNPDGGFMYMVQGGPSAFPRSAAGVVALYSAAFTPGIRAAQAIDAMAVMYTMLSSVLLVLALSFVNPTQIVAQVKEVAPE